MIHAIWKRISPFYDAWDRYQNDDGPVMAAAISYYVGLSLFPLMLLLLAGLGWFMRFTAAGQSAEEHLLRTVSDHLSPALVSEVRGTLRLVQDRSTVQGPIGLLAVLATTLGAFSQFDRAFDRIWAIESPGFVSVWSTIQRLLLQRGIAFLMLLVTGFFLLVVFASSVALSAVRSYTESMLAVPDQTWGLLQGLAAFLLNLTLLFVIYRFLPKRRPGWSDALRGATLAALLWEAGRHLLAYFLIGARYSSAYGLVGSFIAILAWCYYAVTVILLGAEFVRIRMTSTSATVDVEGDDETLGVG
jgi:membrane protein